MGAGGVILPPATYFAKIQQVLKKYDVLLIADEVICGFGRTGNMFGSETYGLAPDIITVAKALSSAYLPISATIISEPIYRALVAQSEKLGVFAHGFTYSGHPVCCAVALETLAIYEERDILGHVRRVAPVLQDGAAALRRPSAGRRGARRRACWRASSWCATRRPSALPRPGARHRPRPGEMPGAGADPARDGRHHRLLPAAGHHRRRDRRDVGPLRPRLRRRRATSSRKRGDGMST